MLKSLLVFLLLVVLTAFPVGMIVFGVQLGLEVQDRKTWPSTTGTVLASEIVERTDRSIVLHVRYRYEAGGETYESAGDVGHPGTPSEPPPEFQAAAPITVLYDETAPGTSTPEVGGYGPTIFFIAFGAIGTLILAPFVVFFGAILFAEIMMIKARYHLKKGMQALGEGVEAANRVYDAEGEMPDELAARGTELIEQAAKVKALVRGLERELRGEPEEVAGEADGAKVDADAHVEAPLPFLGYGWFWRRLLLGLAIYAACWGVAAALAWPPFTMGLMFVAVAGGLAAPVASGIWIGQRLVERGRRIQANTLGWTLILVGGVTFGWFASRNKEGYWESVPHGEAISWSGTLGGLALLLFGLGVALRHRQKRVPE